MIEAQRVESQNAQPAPPRRPALPTLRQFGFRLTLRVLAPLLVVAALSQIGFVVVTNRQEDQLQEQSLIPAKRSLDAHLAQRFRALQSLSQSASMARPELGTDAERDAQGYKSVFDADVVVADATGQMLLNTRMPLGSDLPRLPVPAGRSAVKIAWETGAPAAGDLYVGPISRTRQMALAAVVFDRGTPIRTVLSTLEADLVRRWLEEIFTMTHHGVALLDSSGTLIAATPRFLNDARASAWRLKSIERTLDNAPYRLVLQTDRVAELMPAAAALGLTALVSILAVAGALISSKKAAQTLTDDLKAMSPERTGGTHAFHFAQTEQLAQTLRQDRADQARLLDRIQTHERAWLDVLQHLPAPVLVTRQGRFISANDRAVKLFGVPSDRIVDRRAVDCLHAEETTRVMPLLQPLRNTPMAELELLTRIVVAGGEVVNVNLSLVRVEQDDGPLVVCMLRPVD